MNDTEMDALQGKISTWINDHFKHFDPTEKNFLTEATALLAQAEVIEEATGIRPSGIVTANPDVSQMFKSIGFPTILRPNTKPALMYEVELDV